MDPLNYAQLKNEKKKNQACELVFKNIFMYICACNNN